MPESKKLKMMGGNIALVQYPTILNVLRIREYFKKNPRSRLTIRQLGLKVGVHKHQTQHAVWLMCFRDPPELRMRVVWRISPEGKNLQYVVEGLLPARKKGDDHRGAKKGSVAGRP